MRHSCRPGRGVARAVGCRAAQHSSSVCAQALTPRCRRTSRPRGMPRSLAMYRSSVRRRSCRKDEPPRQGHVWSWRLSNGSSTRQLHSVQGDCAAHATTWPRSRPCCGRPLQAVPLGLAAPARRLSPGRASSGAGDGSHGAIRRQHRSEDVGVHPRTVCNGERNLSADGPACLDDPVDLRVVQIGLPLFVPIGLDD